MTAEELNNLMQNHDSTWFTLKDLSEKSGAEESDVKKLINNSDLFVRSVSTTKDGDDLFSTKKDFQSNESFSSRILGAFKNRID